MKLYSCTYQNGVLSPETPPQTNIEKNAFFKCLKSRINWLNDPSWSVRKVRFRDKYEFLYRGKSLAYYESIKASPESMGLQSSFADLFKAAGEKVAAYMSGTQTQYYASHLADQEKSKTEDEPPSSTEYSELSEYSTDQFLNLDETDILTTQVTDQPFNQSEPSLNPATTPVQPNRHALEYIRDWLLPVGYLINRTAAADFYKDALISPSLQMSLVTQIVPMPSQTHLSSSVTNSSATMFNSQPDLPSQNPKKRPSEAEPKGHISKKP